MKHKALFITAIICLIVFISTLTAGLILASTTVGWDEIGDSIRAGTFREQIVRRIEDWSGTFGGRGIGYTVDENRTDNLQGIDTILVRAVSERVAVQAAGSEFQARLSGTYIGLSQLVWQVERQGSTLLVRIRRPWLGIRMANLRIDLQIPEGFAGNVEIHTVSGPCELGGSGNPAWKRVQCESVSGAIQASAAVWPETDLKTVSGAIRADAVAGRLNVNTVSGSVAIGYGVNAIPESSIVTVSGRISLAVPTQSKFSLNYSTVSGNLVSSSLQLQISSQANRRTEATYNGGGSLITARTVSGGLVLEALNASGSGRS